LVKRLLSLYGKRVRIEVRSFFRNKLAVVFTFLLPLLLLVVFATVFRDTIHGSGGQSISFRQYFVASMIAASIFSLSFTSLSIGVAIEQNNGVVKRLAGTPLPRSAYLVGKLGQALVTSVLSVLLMIALGVAFYGLALPASGSQWFTLCWVTILGCVAWSFTGLAYTRLIRDAATAPAFVQPVFLGLLFISGVFFEVGRSPEVLRIIASLFPLKWMAQGLRYAFLPDWVQQREPAHHWELFRVALVLTLWALVALVASVRSFPWRRAD